MCHLNGMRASKNPLPLPSLWDKAWTSISKIIDSLHISNHKDASCKEKYNPEKIKQEIPGGNTIAAEQTFVWLSRFKKILCAMPKCIICFTFIAWLSTEMPTRLLVIEIRRNLYYQKQEGKNLQYKRIFVFVNIF